MMSLDEVKKQFLQQVKVRAYDDAYIDKNEERELLQMAIGWGIDIDSARSALGQICEDKNYVLESKVMKEVKNIIETFAANDGKIDKKEFDDAVAVCKKAMLGKRNDIHAKKLVIGVIQENNFKTKQSMFNHWYDGVKKEVGLA